MAGPVLQHQFDGLERQARAAALGMWIFLASEVLLFTGLFTVYAGYRYAYPAGFAEAGRHNALALGTVNTAVLLTSSLFVALGVRGARAGRRRAVAGMFAAAMALGVLFLALKGVEWSAHFAEGIYPGVYLRHEAQRTEGAALFFTLYYLTTGLHGLHVVAGLAVLGAVAALAWRDVDGSATAVENGGLYWHLVDVIWIFLFPLFYLVG